MINIGIMSFRENIGLNLILSIFVVVFDGLEDPFSCSIIRWIIIVNMMIIGRMKCKEKNRFSVGFDTDGPPQIQFTSSFPTSGIAVSTPVITVAPQKDICPHGRTYPRNAVAIVINIRTTPVVHTFI